MMKVTVLGCSGSNGVPAGGYGWGLCDPNEPKNNRMRPSVLLEKDGFSLVIDAGPDIRHQLARAEKWLIDAVLFTHPHFDHIGGVGDLFGICYSRKNTLPFYTYQECANEIYDRNRYAFEKLTIPVDNSDKRLPLFEFHLIPETGGNVQIGPFNLQLMALDHWNMTTLGVLCGRFAYLIDFKTLAPAQIADLRARQFDVVIMDGNNPADRPNIGPGHVDCVTSAGYAQEIGARITYLSSLPGWHDYQTLKQSLPNGVEPAYDGLSFNIE